MEINVPAIAIAFTQFWGRRVLASAAITIQKTIHKSPDLRFALVLNINAH